MISQVRKRLRLLPKSLKLSLAVIETGIASGFIGIFLPLPSRIYTSYCVW